MNLPDWLQSVTEWEDNLARATNAARDAANSGDERAMQQAAWEVQYAADHVSWAVEEFCIMAQLDQIEREFSSLVQARNDYLKRVEELKQEGPF